MPDGKLDYQFKVDVPTDSLKAGAKELHGVTAALEKLDTKGGHHAESIEHKIRHEFGGVGHAVNYAKNEIHELLEALGLVLAYELGEKIVDKIKEIGEEAIKAAAAGERMDLAFKLSLGEEAGAEFVEFFERIGKHTEFTEMQLKGWGKELVNAGVAADDLDKYMAAAADVAAKSPDKLEGMSRAIEALKRASLTGNVDMRQLRGLSIGVEELKALPQFAGQTSQQIKKALTHGKLSRDELLAIIAGPDMVVGDLALKAGKTMEARITHLKSLPEEIFAKLRHTEGFATLEDAIGRLLDKLDPDGPQGKRIVEGLGGMLDKLAAAVDSIDFEEVADGVVGFVDALKEALDVTIKIGKAIADFAGVGDFIDEIRRRKRKAQEIDEAKAAILAGKEIPRNETTIGMGLAPRGELVKPGVRAWHGEFHTVGEQAGKRMADGLGGQRGKVGDQAAGMGEDAVGAMRKKLQIHSPSVVFEDLGALAAAGFAAGIRGGGDIVDEAVGGMARAPAIAAAGGGAGPISLTIERVEINVVAGPGTDGAAVGREVGRGFSDAIRPGVTDLLEELVTQLGARAG